MTTKFKTTMLNWNKFVGTILLFQTLFLSSAFAQTGPIFTYHGRLVDSTTNTAVNGTVNFLIQLQSTNNCLMYEEVQTKSLSQGVFALNINSGVGTTTYGQTQSGYSFQSIMSNTNTLNLSYATYSSAAITPAHPLPPVGSCTFTPSPARTDSRKLVVYFFNPSDVTMVSWEPLPVQTIGYVPMAVEALNVGGFPSSSLLRFVDGTGNPLATTPLSNANYTELMALLTGTSTTFLRATDPAVGFTGALNGDVTGVQGATVVSSLRGTAVSALAPVTGQYMVYNGTAWEATNGSGGTVTNVSSGNGYVTVTNPTTTPIVTVNVGTVANTVAAGNDSRIVGAIQTGSGAGGDLAGTYPNPTVSSVGGRTSAQINTSVGDTLAATNTNTASTIGVVPRLVEIQRSSGSLCYATSVIS